MRFALGMLLGVVPDFQSFVLSVAQYAGPAILAYFLFVQERRVHGDYEKSAPGKEPHHRRVHTATIVATYVLIAVCVGVWLDNIFGRTRYLEGEFYGLVDQSTFAQDEIAAKDLPHDVKFYMNKLGPEAGKTAVSYVWAGDASISSIPFRFQRRFFQPATSSTTDTGLPTLSGSSLKLDNTGTPPPIQMNFTLDLSKFRTSSSRSIRIRYKPDPAPGKMVLRDGDSDVSLPWESAAACSPSERPRFSLTSFPFPTVFAQDCSKLQPSPEQETELLNQLGSLSLGSQIAAEKRLSDCGACCIGFLSRAVKDPSSALNRDRGVLINNLATVIQHYQEAKIELPQSVYADFALSNYKAWRFTESLEYFKSLKPDYLNKNAQLYFYRGFAESQTSQKPQALADYRTFLEIAPAGPDRGIVHNNIGMVQLLMGQEEEKAGKSQSATEAYKQALESFRMAAGEGFSVSPTRQKQALSGASRTSEKK